MLKNTFKVSLIYIPWISWMAFTIYLSSLPGEQLVISQTPWVERNIKNLLHFIQYFGLYILTYRVIVYYKFPASRYVSLLWCIIFAISDEFHQSFTPNREASLNDIIIDSVGATMALIFTNLLIRHKLILDYIFPTKK